MYLNKAIKPRQRWFSPVAVDPFRHQALVAEALVRNSAPFDAGETLGKGDLLRRRQLVKRGDRFQPGLRIDPGTQSPPILLHLPWQQRLVLESQRPRIGDLLGRDGHCKTGVFHRGNFFAAWIPYIEHNRNKINHHSAKDRGPRGRGRLGQGELEGCARAPSALPFSPT